SPDLRTPEQQQEDMDVFVRGASSLAAVPFGTAYASMLGARSAEGFFSVGAGFDVAGQAIQGGDYRVGQTLAAGGTGLVLGPMTSGSIIGNAIVGGVAGGAHTSATNWMYGENQSLVWGALTGAGAGALGTGMGRTIRQDSIVFPDNLTIPYFQTPAYMTVPMPSANSIGSATQTTIGHIPSLFGNPWVNNGEQDDNK
uniref:hypothetical protein n=1 Tax=Vreelandella olivaria TaxID=390919 RepID=UPI00201F014A